MARESIEIDPQKVDVLVRECADLIERADPTASEWLSVAFTLTSRIVLAVLKQTPREHRNHVRARIAEPAAELYGMTAPQETLH